MRTRVPEPTESLRLRWGTPRGRYLAGLCCLLAGALLIELTNTYFLFGLLAGSVLHSAGWLILPARGWRKYLPAVPSVLALCAMLGGPAQMGLLAVPLAGWLLARQRSPIAFVTLALPIANGFLLAEVLHDYGNFGLALVLSSAVLVASAWLARRISFAGERTLRANAKGSKARIR